MSGSSLSAYKDRAAMMIARFGIECEVKRPLFRDEDGGAAELDDYGKPVSATSSPETIADLGTVGTISAVRFWPSDGDRAERQRTQFGYVDADSPMIAVPIDEDIQADDYIYYEDSVYQLGKPVEYPTHYEFNSILHEEDSE